MNKFLFNLKQTAFSVCLKLFSFANTRCFCLVCGKYCGNICVCKNCYQTYFSISLDFEGRCKKCGKTLVSEENLCMECRNNSVFSSTDKVFPLFSYRLWNSDFLCRWKLEEERIYSSFFAALVNSGLKKLRKSVGDFILVPVPPRPGKIKEKGWDQIQELCAFLKFKFGWKVENLLERKTSVQQKTLDRKNRMETIANAFSVLPQINQIPEQVCIIDDVITTGSTIEACASVLKEKNKAVKGYALSIFIVD